MSSPAQKVKANISSMGIREGCSAKDSRCPHPTLRWLMHGALAVTVLRTWRCPFPTCKGGVIHFTGTKMGNRGEKMGKQHDDIPYGYFPLLPCQHLACLLLQGCSCVREGDMSPALLSPSLPLLVTAHGLCHVPGTGGMSGVSSDTRGCLD